MVRAADAFDDETMAVEDDRRDYGDVRYISIGFPDEVIVALVWTPRKGAYRIISMTRTNERERRLRVSRF